jgi:predicted DNA binding CopG/RHH family protein
MKPKHVPMITSDEQAEAFLAQDLSNLDYTAFKPLSWELHPKTARLNMRLPQGLVDAAKAKARAHGIPYQRLIREAIERMVSSP